MPAAMAGENAIITGDTEAVDTEEMRRICSGVEARRTLGSVEMARDHFFPIPDHF